MVECGSLLLLCFLLVSVSADLTVHELRDELIALHQARAKDMIVIEKLRKQLNIDDDAEEPPKTDLIQQLRMEREELNKLVEMLTSLKNDLSPKQGGIQPIQSFKNEVFEELQNLRKNEKQYQKAQIWLQDSLKQLKSEVTEIARSVNNSARIQEKQQTDSELGLIHKDLTSLRKDLAHLEASQQKDQAGETQLETDILEIKSRLQMIYNENQHRDIQIKRIQSDQFTILNGRQQHSRKKRNAEDTVPPLRHHHGHHLKTEMNHIRHRLDEMHKKQEKFEAEILIIKKQQRNFEDQIDERPSPSNEQVANLTNSMSAINKLHASTLQLFEALENLEEKVEKEINVIQKEVSKVEAVSIKTQSAFEVLREDYFEQSELIKSHKRSICQLEDKYSNHTIWITRLETDQLLSSSESRLKQTDQLLQESRVDQVELELDEISKEQNKILTENHLQNLTEEVKEIQNKNKALNHEVSLLLNHLPKDCEGIDATKQEPILVHLPGLTTSVFCSGGYTVIQRRVDASEDFNKDWEGYKKGFGDRKKNFWAGNDYLHLLTASGNYSLHIDLWDVSGVYRYAQYQTVTVSGEEDNYRIKTEGFQGNASDALAYHNEMGFSTPDRDHDKSEENNCALYYSSGWWYNQCQYVNLNGHYTQGITWFDRSAHEWLQLSHVEIKLKASTF